MGGVRVAAAVFIRCSRLLDFARSPSGFGSTALCRGDSFLIRGVGRFVLLIFGGRCFRSGCRVLLRAIRAGFICPLLLSGRRFFLPRKASRQLSARIQRSLLLCRQRDFDRRGLHVAVLCDTCGKRNGFRVLSSRGFLRLPVHIYIYIRLALRQRLYCFCRCGERQHGRQHGGGEHRADDPFPADCRTVHGIFLLCCGKIRLCTTAEQPARAALYSPVFPAVHAGMTFLSSGSSSTGLTAPSGTAYLSGSPPCLRTMRPFAAHFQSSGRISDPPAF